jgi:hypothetical protein
MLSMNDVVLKAAEAADKEAAQLSYGDVVNTYKSICQHQLPMLQSQATAG